MYEKKINIFNDIDRHISNVSFKYNVIFLLILLILVFTLILWKKDYYYQNSITFKDNKNAMIVVDKDKYNNVSKNSILMLDTGEFKYNIDKIDEKDYGYILYIHFDKELNIKTSIYKILLKKESLFEYIIRIIGGN